MNYQHVKVAELEETSHVGVLHVAPLALVVTFGEPDNGATGSDSIGEYYYKSENGDFFVVYSLDPDVTAENIEQTKHQFWSVNEPVPLSIGAKHDADVGDFKYWIRKQIIDNS